MKITALDICNFRNIEKVSFEPSENINIIFGENAQGKTNLIESIWLFTGCRSFRNTKDSDFIRFGEKNAVLKMDFFSNDRDQEAKIVIGEKKEALLNGIKLKTVTKFAGETAAVVFTPEDLSIIKEGPSVRRRFIDSALSQLKPGYTNLISKYNRILLQRNNLLKDIQRHSELRDTLEIWDDRLCTYAAAITKQRSQYIKHIFPILEETYSGISGNKEKIDIKYLCESDCISEDEKEIKAELLLKTKNNFSADIMSGSTNTGPHRDDILISLDNLDTRNFASQGQQRSCAISLKLSEAELIKNITDIQPVILLDDVMSELDSNRSDYILNHIENRQVFITCCEPSAVLNGKTGKTFIMKEGELCIST